MKSRIFLNKLLSPNLIISFILINSLFFCWFVSEPIRAAKIDRYILYYVDEVIRYFHVKVSLYNPFEFLNPYAKPLSIIASNLFLRLFPFGMVSLRIMNALFSAGTLILLSNIMKRMGFNRSSIILAVLISITFPICFLSTFSVLSEPMFTFLLMLAIYLYYCKSYVFSSGIVSLLPLVRQEGVLYIFVWIIFLIKERKMRLILFFFIPISLWIMANKVILGHPLYYIFLFLPKASQGLPPDSLLNVKDLRLSYFIGYFPMFFLFLLGIKIRISDKRYLLSFVCIFVCMLLIAMLNIFVFITKKQLVYELRFLIPVIPLVSIYVLTACKGIADKYIIKNNLSRILLVFTLCFLFFLNFYQLKQLQKLPYVLANVVTSEQENNIKLSADWLKDYLKNEGIKNVYYRKMTNKVIRRILMYLPGNMKFCVLGSHNILDVVTFKLENLPKTKAVFFTIDGKDDVIEKLNLRLIKEFSSVPLYIYLFDNK